jgi:hypothetical protein
MAVPPHVPLPPPPPRPRTRYANDRAAAAVVVGLVGVLLSWTVVGGIALGLAALALANDGRRRALGDPMVLGRRQATVGAALGVAAIVLGVGVAAVVL